MSSAGDPGRLEHDLRRYVEERFAHEDAVLVELRAELELRGFPMIQVPASTGRALEVLVRATGGRRVLEVGTLGGYSAIWMARAMAPGGHLTSLEIDDGHARLAREFIGRAGLVDRVDIRVGDATDLLPTLGPDAGYDVVFLDADKEGYVGYAAEARRLLRRGGLLLADNAFWSGRVLEAPSDEAAGGIQAFNDYVAGSDWLAGTILPVGDGLVVACKIA